MEIINQKIYSAARQLRGKEEIMKELSMALKAKIFEYDLFDRFNLEGQILCKLKNPTPEHPFISYNMPDDAYMTGMMTAVFSFKYSVTKDPEDKKTVSLLLQGLDKLCHVSGKKGHLARAWWPLDNPNFSDGDWYVNEEQGVRWSNDVSTDQMDGVFFGFYYAYKLASDDAEKALIAGNVRDLIDAVINDGFRIIGVNGKMTRWGNYTVAHTSEEDHLHGFLLLQHLKIAEYVTGDKKYGELYRKISIEEKSAYYSVVSWLPLPPVISNHSDNVMYIMELLPMLELEQDSELRALVLQGLRCFAYGYSKENVVLPNGMTPYDYLESRFRKEVGDNVPGIFAGLVEGVKAFWNGDDIFHGVRIMGTPIYNFVFKHYLGENEDRVPVKCKDTLRYFPLDMKMNSGTIKKYEEMFDFKFDPSPKTPKLPEEYPIPIDRRKKDWSAFVQNPYGDPDEVELKEDGVMEYNGHDYLFGYWLGRMYGYISEDE